MSGKRGPRLSSFSPMSGLSPIRLMWSVVTSSVPAGMSGFMPPHALVMMSVRQPSALSTRTGKPTCCML